MTEILQSKLQWSRYVTPDLIQHFYVLATDWINWFWEDLRKNIFYFHTQHYRSGLYDRDFTICSPLFTVCTARLTFNFTTFCHRVNFCVLWGSVNKWRLFLYATITDIFIQQRFHHIFIYKLNWLVYIAEISPSQAQCSLYVTLDYRSTLLRCAFSVFFGFV